MRRLASARSTRRDFLVKAAYVAPTILTLPAVLSIASAGSGTSPQTFTAPPPGGGGGGKDDDGGSCTAWWHIFFCFPPWKGNIF